MVVTDTAPIPALLNTWTSAPAGPVLTWYGPDSERVELTGSVLANWVTKATNLLQDEADAAPEVRVGLALPPHWRTLVWALAVWNCGAEVVFPTSSVRAAGPGEATTSASSTPSGGGAASIDSTTRAVDVQISAVSGAGAAQGPGGQAAEAERTAGQAAEAEGSGGQAAPSEQESPTNPDEPTAQETGQAPVRIAVALPALARQVDDLPPGAIDGAAELMSQPDVLVFPPEWDPQAPALANVLHGELGELGESIGLGGPGPAESDAGRPGSGGNDTDGPGSGGNDTDGPGSGEPGAGEAGSGRYLLTPNSAEAAVRHSLAVWCAGGSVVLVGDATADIAHIAAQEDAHPLG